MKRILKYLIGEGLPLTFVIFYCVGLALYFVPITHKLFIMLTPYTLVLTALIIFYHHKKWNSITMAVFAGIFVLSIVAEIIGVATGKLFGVYNYQHGLGFKIFEVPVLIGLNWVVLIYSSNSILSKFSSKKTVVIIGSALLMVLYDIILEKAAPLMEMWDFKDSNPPINNYVMWFLLSLLFSFGIQHFKINTLNKPAPYLFVTQGVFFVVIILLNTFINS